MSLYTPTSSLLALKPTVRRSHGKIITTTPFLVSLLTLFSYRKEIIFNILRKTVEINKTVLWVSASSERIPFRNIEMFDSEIGTMPTQWSFFYGTKDQIEWIKMYAVVKSPPDRKKLWTFIGEGSVKTGGRGVLLGGDDIVDFRGDQFEAFDKLKELVEEATGIKVR